MKCLSLPGQNGRKQCLAMPLAQRIRHKDYAAPLRVYPQCPNLIVMVDMDHLLCNSGTITALRCLAYFLCKKEKTKSTPREASDSHIPYVLREVPVSMHSIVC